MYKDIKGFEGIYKVYSDGTVVSYPRTWGFGNIVNSHDGKIMKLSLDRYGYYKVNLKNKENSKLNVQVHRLIAEHFIPNPKNLPQVNHKNGIKNDNRVENLEWVSNSGNIKHAYNIGLKTQKGALNNNSKLNEDKVKEIKRLLLDGVYQRNIAYLFGVSQTLISAINRRKIWKHI